MRVVLLELVVWEVTMRRGQNVLIGSLLNMGICPWYRLQQRLLIVGAAGFGKGVQIITTLTISRSLENYYVDNITHN